VKAQIMGLFLPLLPPPPRQPEAVRHAPILPSSSGTDTWWPSQMTSSQPQDSWKMLPSSPSATSSCESNSNMWTNMSMGELQLPSPAPSFSQPYTTGAYCESATSYCEPTTSYCEPTTTMSYCEPEYYSIPMPMSYPMSMPMSFAPIAPSLPPPSMLAQQCSTSAGYGGLGGFGGLGNGFGWDRYNEYTMPYATTI
jgi:hypothetical protein